MTIGRIPSVEGGIQPTIVDAKGDLIAGVAADSVNRLAVGDNDQVLVADSSTSTGLAWKSYGAQFVAGKNKIINGDFSIWQRGTSFSNPASGAYFADRTTCFLSGTGQTRTISQQTFTPGSAPVSGYEGQYFLRFNQSVAGTNPVNVLTLGIVEDVRTLAGQTVTLSYWAKVGANSGYGAIVLYQNFGSGGSTTVTTTIENSPSYTTSWVRYSHTFTMPSISGKTIGTGSYIKFDFNLLSNQTFTFDIWGLQLEAGSVATPFTTATGTLQGELAAARRYYYRLTSADNVYTRFGFGSASSTTKHRSFIIFPTEMRVAPTSVDTSAANTFNLWDGVTDYTVTAIANGLENVTRNGVSFVVDTTGMTQFRPYFLMSLNTTTAYIGWNAEL